MPVHGWPIGGDRNGASYDRGRGALGASVAAVPAGVRVEGIAGRWLRETRVGPACDRFTLFALV